ncbi:MAG TPA: PBP1A family penicillin-binding protein [Hyphomicrobiales bacterium]|nr:PBP1A family penicillin-binding protein [Hyphomicrobiales bacterium]
MSDEQAPKNEVSPGQLPLFEEPEETKGGKRSIWIKRGLVALLALFAAGALAFTGTMLWALDAQPVRLASAQLAKPSIVLEAADGTLLARKGAFRLPDAAHEQFPDHLVDAVIAIEDRRFRRHWGVDPQGIVRAAYRNVDAGRIVEGGSTITQQLVKLSTGERERTFMRKLREAFLAVWLETRLDKDEILTRYLNNVYLGAGNRGVPAAARAYFGKRPSELTLAESALLAGLIKAPSQLSPLRGIETARERAAVVLDAMVETGAIDRKTADEAKANPAELNPQSVEAQAGSWFADWAAQEAAELGDPFTSDTRIRTTLVRPLQELAQQVVDDALAKSGEELGFSQAALVAMRPDGAVLAMVGGRDYAQSEFNRAVQAKRQPGSAFKLFVYFAALRAGYRPDDWIKDAPIDVDGWQPENYNRRYAGRVTLAEAFARSLNAATARLAMDVGIGEVVAAARDLGIDAPLPENPSLALGTSEVSLLDLTAAYASVRAGRMPVEPWGIAAVGSERSGQLYRLGPSTEQRQSLGPYRGELVELLQDVVRRGTGRAARLDGFSAGKTGTSQNYRDAWFIGFNESLVVGVWVGNDDGTPMKQVTGGRIPARIWKDFMVRATPLMEGDELLLSGGFRRPVVAEIGFDEQPRCDIEACAAAYRSFRASDCTYQPYNGPRKLCTKGDPAGNFASFEPSPGPQVASDDRRISGEEHYRRSFAPVRARDELRRRFERSLRPPPPRVYRPAIEPPGRRQGSNSISIPCSRDPANPC